MGAMSLTASTMSRAAGSNSSSSFRLALVRRHQPRRKAAGAFARGRATNPDPSAYPALRPANFVGELAIASSHTYGWPDDLWTPPAPNSRDGDADLPGLFEPKCSTDAGCTEGRNGRSTRYGSYWNEGSNAVIEYACRTCDDECADDADCPARRRHSGAALPVHRGEEALGVHASGDRHLREQARRSSASVRTMNRLSHSSASTRTSTMAQCKCLHRR
jgi:hypothetical protein